MSWNTTSRCVSKNYLKLKDFEILSDPEIYFLIFTRKVIIFLWVPPYDVFALKISASSIAIFIKSEIL